MIIRLWRGWTEKDGAQAYQRVLTEQVVPMIRAYDMPGFRGIKTMRRAVIGDDGTEEVEFATLMEFDDLAYIRDFVGEDIDTAHIPEAARAVLKRWEARVSHYELFES